MSDECKRWIDENMSSTFISLIQWYNNILHYIGLYSKRFQEYVRFWKSDKLCDFLTSILPFLLYRSNREEELTRKRKSLLTDNNY